MDVLGAGGGAGFAEVFVGEVAVEVVAVFEEVVADDLVAEVELGGGGWGGV